MSSKIKMPWAWLEAWFKWLPLEEKGMKLKHCPFERYSKFVFLPPLPPPSLYLAK